jgi:hypothetical protein
MLERLAWQFFGIKILFAVLFSMPFLILSVQPMWAGIAQSG